MSFESINAIDIAFLLIALILVLRAALHGFVDEVMGIAWIVFGLLSAVYFYDEGAAFIRTKAFSEVKYLPEVIAFISLFLIVFILVKILTAILKDIIARIKLSGLDHVLGAVFGLIEGIVVVSLVVFVINIQPLFDGDKFLQKSVVAGVVKSHLDEAKKFIGVPGK
ncbi:hypothetical protein FACS189494_06570 [Spirochaetia bacterium]|nr:hypothetical protein FACS189494_06570 [Spirochaetia bacterium]